MLQGKQTATLKSLKPLHFYRKPVRQGPLPRNITNFLLLNGSDLFQRIMSLNGADKQAPLTEVLCHQPQRHETSQRPVHHWLAAGTQKGKRRVRAPNQCPPAIPVDSRQAGQSSCRSPGSA